jgi:predicted Zn-dependent protease
MATQNGRTDGGHSPGPTPHPTPAPRNQPRASAPVSPRVVLHPEAETLAYGYSDLLMELDHARARISELQRKLEDERRERLYWKNFVRQVSEAGTRMLQGGDA